MLEDDLEFGEVAAQRDQVLVNEGGLAVEQVDVAAGDLAVHQQQQAFALHGFERRVDLAQVGDAVVAVGGGAGRVELAGDDAGGLGAHDFLGRQVVGEVQRHQRLEGQAFGHGRKDALLVLQRLGGRGHRRLEVGMMTARANCAAVCGTTLRMASPSRTCRCQSSGRVIVRVSRGAVMVRYCPIAVPPPARPARSSRVNRP